eukprot:1814127-Alexandrium_andersonii.AAC.1
MRRDCEKKFGTEDDEGDNDTGGDGRGGGGGRGRGNKRKTNGSGRVAKAKLFLNNLEMHDIPKFRKLHAQWKAAAGPSCGNQKRMGAFDWVRYTEEYFSEAGRLDGQDKIMATKKEFIDAMVAKGRDKAWAEQEYTKRLMNESGEWRTDVCPDTQLQRVQMHGKTKQTGYDLMGKRKSVTEGTKEQKNPKRSRVEDMVQGLGKDDVS